MVFDRLSQWLDNRVIGSDGWRYKKSGLGGRRTRHVWTKGGNELRIYWMNGAGHHAGFVVEYIAAGSDTRQQLTNGFANSFRDALVLADLKLRDDRGDPAAFMHSDRVSSDKGLSDNSVRQDEWLHAHAHDYEFQVLDPSDYGVEHPSQS